MYIISCIILTQFVFTYVYLFQTYFFYKSNKPILYITWSVRPLWPHFHGCNSPFFYCHCKLECNINFINACQKINECSGFIPWMLIPIGIYICSNPFFCFIFLFHPMSTFWTIESNVWHSVKTEAEPLLRAPLC